MSSRREPRGHSLNPFVVRVTDLKTGRGVPVVELSAFNQRTWYTDSNGVVAIDDPWAMGRDLALQVRCDGYRFHDRVLNEPGTVVKVRPGRHVELVLQRVNIAERLYRVTGAGIYADSVAAQIPVPIRKPLINGGVLGQDTAIAILWNRKVYWFWGDTFGLNMVNFQVSGATSRLPERGGLNPECGVDLDYFVDRNGFSRPMLPLNRPGMVWLEGLMIVRDKRGEERLLATYARIGRDHAVKERGLAGFEERGRSFRVLVRHASARPHRSSHPVRLVVGGQAFWYLYPTYRIPDDWDAVRDPRTWESFVCDRRGARWKAGAAFVDGPEGERSLVEAGSLPNRARRFAMTDADTGKPVSLTVGSFAWNAYRRKWILLGWSWGDVYYAEACAPEGPWTSARRIVTHTRYNFYNVVHHPFFDRDGGRVIYFEGTYSTALIDQALPTPLYDYNQILYRLSLDDRRLVQ